MREARYVNILTVFVPSADALIDMLRYDACYPRTEEDARKIIRLMNGGGDDRDHLVELVRASRNDAPPTHGRWRSFGCQVIDVRHPNAEVLDENTLRQRVLGNYSTSGVRR